MIQLENVSKRFQGRVIFDEASAKFDKGVTYGLVGPNGTGKSVLLKMIVGFLKPDQGTLTYSPELEAKRGTWPRHIGAIIDRPAYQPQLTGYENLEYLARIQNKIGKPEIVAALQRVGLDPENKTLVSKYSLGMKQKLALAQAFMENPKIIILDEPFNALDKASVQMVRDLMRSFKSEGKTVIFTSHNQADIDELADHVYEIENEKLSYVR